MKMAIGLEYYIGIVNFTESREPFLDACWNEITALPEGSFMPAADQASALALSRANSSAVMVPASSKALASLI